jgi:NAD(P)-dependent dehydrogenase (short-subunit alcohol dehydrogenase family)
MRIVITGANRGIGLELTRQFLARGDHVEAAVRDPDGAKDLSGLLRTAHERLRIFAIDITSERSVHELARALGDVGVDMLVNNAGVMEKSRGLEQLDYAALELTMDTNALGPLRVTAALLPHMRRNSVRKIVHVSSEMGSIEGNASGGWYGYRMSKAALNMACKSMAHDLRGEGFTVVAVHPGWVQTDMGGAGAPTGVAESAKGLIAVFDRMGRGETGKFLDYRGQTLPW